MTSTTWCLIGQMVPRRPPRRPPRHVLTVDERKAKVVARKRRRDLEAKGEHTTSHSIA
jgi:hypothetical protein